MQTSTLIAMLLALSALFGPPQSYAKEMVVCGSATGGMFPSPPTSDLCAPGFVLAVPVAPLGATQYQWTCKSPYKACIANKKYNGQCGTANGVATSSAPSANLCALGTASTPAQAGANYTWTCTGVLPATGATIASCAAPASIVQAVSETAAAAAGSAGSANVRANDTAPGGTIYTLAAGSTCNPISITALGVVSYTAPAAGQSCTVNYTLCNSGQCATATLTVNGVAAPSIVNAVSETVTATAGAAGSENVRANDTAPAGSVYALAAGSTCNPIGITALGVVSYTAPPGGQSCTVNYTVCNSGQCSTATLTVNASTPPPSTLSISKSVSGSAMVVGLANQFYTLTITVANGPTSNPIHINDTLPAGIVTSGAIGSSGGTLTSCPASGAMSLAGCSLSAGLANGTYNVTIPVGVGSAATTGTNTASISSHNSNCATANPACTTTTGKVLITPASGGLGTGTGLGSAVVSANLAAVTALKLYTIGVTVSGLPAGKSVVLQNNGGNNLTVSANGAATFSDGVPGAYAVTVLTQPAGAICLVNAGSGTATASVNSIAVVCALSRFVFVPKSGGGNHPVTDCVKDSVTSLTWEGKTPSGSRSGGNSYTNYDDTTKLQGWEVWTMFGVQGASPANVTTSQINASTNSIGYRNYVNSSSLCGHNDWRLPTLAELNALCNALGSNIAIGIPSIVDQSFFPNQHFLGGWTSTAGPIISGSELGYIACGSAPYDRSMPNSLRLVR
jgi:hypothetical protein